MPDIDTLRPIYASQSEVYPEKMGESSTMAQEKPVEGKVARRFPEEEDEELLRESNDRFVLFPIKYREVS